MVESQREFEVKEQPKHRWKDERSDALTQDQGLWKCFLCVYIASKKDKQQVLVQCVT